MGQFVSKNTMNNAILWEETYFESGLYTSKPCSPLVVTFDINPDTLDPENIEEVLPGTDIGVIEVNGDYEPRNRRSYVTLSDGSPNNVQSSAIFARHAYSHGSYNISAATLVRISNGSYQNIMSITTNRIFISHIQVGAYYFPASKRYYIFIQWIYSTGRKRIHYDVIENLNEYEQEYINFFYPTISPSYYLTLTNPKSRYFNVGQSSELKFALKGTDYEQEVDATITPLSIPANWNYDENTKTLTLISTATSAYATFSASYETPEYTYDVNVAFFPSISNPYTGGGISAPAGGGGSFGRDETSDSIDVPTSSAAGNLSDSSTFTRYLANEAFLDIVGEWLWSDDLGLQIAKSFISLLYGDPSQSIISLMSYPFDIRSMSGVSTVNQEFYWGSQPANFNGTVITSNSAYINWGTVTLQEYWGNFLDYAPHTKIQLYLPWGTGFVDIDPGEVLPGSISVVTNIDLFKGSCVHIVTNTLGNPIATYSGQCAQQIPMFASDFASKMAGIVTAGVAGLVGGGSVYAAGISGGIAGGAEPIVHSVGGRAVVDGDRLTNVAVGFVEGTQKAMSGQGSFGAGYRMAGKIATTSLAVNRSPVSISRSGSFTDGSASLGVQYPYLIISRPTQSMPEEYGHHFGYPSNIYSNLGALRGYTEVGEVHLEGFIATESELAEIDRLLKGGVIL